ncbi:MAG: endonuclease III, partial [Gemmatimonadales bacterium]
MTRETKARRASRAKLIFKRLARTYPDAKCALDYRNAFELLCATILSAQCTDARVNLVTPTLFARFPTPQALAVASPGEVQDIIRSAGFFRNKTKSLIGMARALMADCGGEVPRSMEQLRRLPGVGRKTANVVLGNAYGINEGIA